MSAREPVGLRIIIVYKLLKSVLQIAAAVGLWIGLHTGLTHWLLRMAAILSEHAVHPWSLHLAHALTRAVTPGHIRLLALVLAGDAVVSAFEGWVLQRGYAWAPWVVVGSTASLLPLELLELVRRPRAGRAALFIINSAIVLYLVLRTRRSPEGTVRPVTTRTA